MSISSKYRFVIECHPLALDLNFTFNSNFFHGNIPIPENDFAVDFYIKLTRLYLLSLANILT